MPDSIKDITEYEAYLMILNILLDKEKCESPNGGKQE